MYPEKERRGQKKEGEESEEEVDLMRNLSRRVPRRLLPVGFKAITYLRKKKQREKEKHVHLVDG